MISSLPFPDARSVCLNILLASAFLFSTLASSQTFIGQGGLAIPPGAPAQSTGTTISNVTVTGVGTVSSCIEISVLVNLNHTWDADLNLLLFSPGGISLDLSTANGGSGDDYLNTYFQDNSGPFITSGSAPFNGDFRPEGRSTAAVAPHSNGGVPGIHTFQNTYSGINADGIWRLEIQDFLGVDVGTLNSWSITFVNTGGGSANPASIDECETALFGGLATFDLTSVDNTVNGGTGTGVQYWQNAAATVSIGSPSAYVSGDATVYATLVGGCGAAAPITLTVLPLPLANPITYLVCDNGNNTGNFDLTFIESAVLGGQPNTIAWFEDPALTIPIGNPTNFVSSPTTIYAQTDNGDCTNIGVITLGLEPGPNPTNSSITLVGANPICGSPIGTASISFTLPTGGPFDIMIDYGNTVNGFQTFSGLADDGDVIGLPYDGTTDFILTSVVSQSNPTCGGTFPSPVTITLTVNIEPDLFTSDQPETCAGGSFDLSTINITDLNNSGATITFHSSTPPSPGNELPSTVVNPTSTTTYYAYAQTAPGCDNVLPIVVTINAAGTPVLQTDDICENDGLYDLTQLEDPAFSGSWSGTGVSGDFFDPAGLNGIYTLTFTPDNSCGNIETTDVEVLNGGTPILGTTQLCDDVGLYDLTALEDPSFPNGTWSGTAVTTGTFFDPSGQNGFVTLTFTSDNVCDDLAFTDIEVLPSGTPVLASDQICEDFGLYDLTQLEDPSFSVLGWAQVCLDLISIQLGKLASIF